MTAIKSPGLSLALISLPWALCNRPSLQLGALKGYLVRELPGFEVSCLHPYLGLARDLGPELYRAISLDPWLCEGFYAGLLFPEQQEKLRGFLDRRLRKIPAARHLSPDELQTRIAAHLDRWLKTRNWSAFDLLGFSLCFNQLSASLLAAKRLKIMHPRLAIVFGGSSCVTWLGASLLSSFPWFDFVIHGEGELPLAALCRCLAGDGLPLPPQVLCRGGSEPADRFTGGQVSRLDELPCPDYDDYFAELNREFSGEPFVPELPVEFSRGCWWGKCAFCNLNLQWQGYRGKSAARMAAEVEGLAARHRCLDFCFSDNALPPREAGAFFARMTESRKDYRFFAELRVNQRSDLALYRRGGLTSVQAGIEALSQSLLVRMNKGATVLDNLALMKESLALGIRLNGNLIICFPGSTAEEVAETIANLDFALPFTPLAAATFFLGHGSPVSKRPGDFGISLLCEHPHNRKLFPPAILSGLTLLIGDYRGDRSKQRKLWRPVAAKIRAWHDFHRARPAPAHLAPPLSFRDGEDFLLIRQELPGKPTLHHRLRGVSRELYLACDQPVELAELIRRFPEPREGKIIAFLAELSAKRLLFAQGTRYLALAIPEGINA